MRKTLTVSDVTRLVAEAVEEKGADHVSPLYFVDKFADGPLAPSAREDEYRVDADSACRYIAPDGSAGCIVGQVLTKAGVPRELLSSKEGKSAALVLMAWEVTQIVDATAEARELLSDMQTLQDHGVPWGWMAENAGRRPY